MSGEAPRVATCLWFDGQAEAAARFWTSLLPDSGVDRIDRGPEGKVLLVAFTLGGVPYLGLNGGPDYKPSPAHSFFVRCADDAEIDRLWSALLEGGGEAVKCGWLKDRFGFSWQIVPTNIEALLFSGDREADGRAFALMLTMTKLNASALDAARRGG